MKEFLLFLVLLSSVFSLTTQESRHLLALTSVGYKESEIQSLLAKSKSEAIEVIFQLSADNSPTNTPSYLQNLPTFKEFRKLPKSKKQEMRKEARKRGIQLQADWYTYLSSSQSQLREKMVLFWHNHFVSSLKKVKNPRLMFIQHNLFRKHALGSFKDFLHAIIFDPAMIHYLDTQSNQKGKANENFARELLELFTLGIGNYNENDIKEIAKAFTGYKANHYNGKFRMQYNQHDHSKKTIFGKTQRFMGQDVIDLILEQKSLAPFIVRKISKQFIYHDLSQFQIDRLSTIFRKDYNIAILIQEILRLDEFWNEQNQGVFIKSPVELMVGVVRYFDLQIKDPKIYVKLGRQMNQVLLNPPNVKGWPGGKHWINSHTYIVRQNISNRLSNNMKNMMKTSQKKVNLEFLVSSKYYAQFQNIHKKKRKLRQILKSDYFQLK
ncbi:DUF1800 domain-containing protein [bacterium]|nr:DUF1800 domain-containing protein [bacterium]